MSAVGYIQVHAFASYAQIPLNDVVVTVTDVNGSAIAMRLTNRSGQLDSPIEIVTPERTASQSPNSGSIPYAIVNLYARLENYEEIDIERLQIFANTVTVQKLELIPLSEFPGTWNKAEVFETPAQNL